MGMNQGGLHFLTFDLMALTGSHTTFFFFTIFELYMILHSEPQGMSLYWNGMIGKNSHRIVEGVIILCHLVMHFDS